MTRKQFILTLILMPLLDKLYKWAKNQNAKEEFERANLEFRKRITEAHRTNDVKFFERLKIRLDRLNQKLKSV
jgi:hypothetical protein